MLNRKNTPVYVSTTAIGSENLETIVKKFNKHGIRNIELSYGIFERGFEKSFKNFIQIITLFFIIHFDTVHYK